MFLLIVRRLLVLIPILFGVLCCTFLLARILPGDPVVLMLGVRASPEQVSALRTQFGLDQPLPVQFATYLTQLLRGDLGQSLRGQTPVLDEILLRLPSTVELAVAGLLLAVGGGLAVGVIGALTTYRWLEQLFLWGAMVVLSLPIIWLAPLLIIVVSVWLRWLPVTGGDGIRGLILPSISLAIGPGALIARVSHAALRDILHEDYIRTAHAKGLARNHLYWRHLLPNACFPVISILGLFVSSLMTGALFVEVIFARPGLGRFAVNALLNRDLPQIQGVVLVSTVVFVLVNLVVDLCHHVLDPRLRYE